MDMCKRFSAFSAGRRPSFVVFLFLKNLYRIFNVLNVRNLMPPAETVRRGLAKKE
jgi:hypothetical protein